MEGVVSDVWLGDDIVLMDFGFLSVGLYLDRGEGVVGWCIWVVVGIFRYGDGWGVCEFWIEDEGGGVDGCVLGIVDVVLFYFEDYWKGIMVIKINFGF